MTKKIQIAIIAMILLGVAAAAQTVPSQKNGPGPAQGSVSILHPAAGAKLSQNFVNVQFALTNPGAAASPTPTFEVRLDSRDPVTTTSESHTFTGLTPGPHTVTVQLVDANGTPVNGGKAIVQFAVLRSSAQLRQPMSIAEALRINPSDVDVQNAAKPEPVANAGGALPLISVVGFGVLLGGIASAMKSR